MFRTTRVVAAMALVSSLLACQSSDLTAPFDATERHAPVSSALSSDTARRFRIPTLPVDSASGDSRSTGFLVPVRATGFALTPIAFGSTATGSCLQEGSRFGEWTVRYHGYGCVSLEQSSGTVALAMEPTSALSFAATHAPLTVGPQHGDRFVLSTEIETVRQTRVGGAPNPWEVAWVIWQFTDDEHFYYFIPKPDGWELGKRDPAYPGGQRFLATGTQRVFPIGQVYRVEVQQRGTLMSVSVDGVELVQFRDTERPYRAGRFALYSEDAAIRVHEVSSL